MTAEIFHQIFDQLRDPVLLHSGEEWLVNPTAQALNLSENDLQRFEEWGGDAFFWFSLQFYHITSQLLDGELLVILHPDSFLANTAQNVSSQLRQRLQSAFGCTADLSQTKGIRDDLRARERLSGINRELYQLFRMAQELEMSQPSAMSIAKPECIDLLEILIQTCDEVKELLRGTQIELKLETDLPVLIMMGDPEKLNYLLLSLLSNSMSHLPTEKGQVTVSLKEQKGQAILTVSDNGSGFSPDLLSHPLWNEPNRLVFGRGLGLGLPLVQRIAAAHNGSVMVVPTENGSRVTVSLPIETLSECTFAAPPAPMRNMGGFSIAKVLLSNVLPRSVYYPLPDDD